MKIDVTKDPIRDIMILDQLIDAVTPQKRDNVMSKTRFIVAKKFENDKVILSPKDSDALAIPLSGINGLASMGFVALLNAQTQDGPKTKEYYHETGALLATFLSAGWLPGDSPQIMKRLFQLARAVWVHKNANRPSGKPKVSFRTRVKEVRALPDEVRNWLFSQPVSVGGFADIISEWNNATEATPKPKDMTDLFSE